MVSLILAGVVIGGIGLVCAVALGVAAKIFYVEVDPLILEIEEALPGANCGGCGHPGCSGAAAAIAQGRMAANGCVAGGAEVGVVIAGILGVEIKETEPQKAQVGCRYPLNRSDLKFDYEGVTDCRAAVLLSGGPKECPVGCIGLGACVKACPFDALSLGPDQMPVVDLEKCTGCGSCVRTCPVGIMQLTSVTDRILNEFTWGECTAPCQRRCPAGIDIPEQIRLTALGQYDEALKKIKERNPLPLICGRICPAPCEMVCRRNLADEPVAINHLKRYVSDLEREKGAHQQAYKAPATGRKAAVIGGGVMGLSTGYFLARLGHSPKIYEAQSQLGGILRTALPENRLPREVLDWEIEGVMALGVEAETESSLGRNVKLSELFDQGHEAVVLALGGWDALLRTGAPVELPASLPGLHLLLPLALAWARDDEVEIGRKTALVGETAQLLPLARRCLDKGAESVTIFCPAAKNGNLSAEEEAEAAEAGIRILNSARITSLFGVGDTLTGLAYSQFNRLAQEMQIDSVILAAGRIPSLLVIKDLPPVEKSEAEAAEETEEPCGSETPWRVIAPYSLEIQPTRGGTDLFPDRKPASDHWAAVEAIGAGRRAAASVHKFFNGEPLESPPDGDISRGPEKIGVCQVEHLQPTGPRNPMPEIDPNEALDPAREIALGYDQASAQAEASRCLNCGLICYQRTQYN